MGKHLKANSVIFVVTRSALAARSLSTIYRGYLSEVKQQITDMAVNGSGMRDPARVLKISRNTVTQELKNNEQYCAE